MNYKLAKEVVTILNKFTDAGFQIFIVGGAVRDLSMNRVVKDWDFTTDAKPEEILKLFPEGFYDNKFGTVGIANKHPRGEGIDIHHAKHLGGGGYEITTMRKEGGYKDHRHPSSIVWTNKIEEDLARRDFTINAIALGYKSKHPRGEGIDIHHAKHLGGGELELIDPFNGQQDIANKIIRTVGDPNDRFQEDALRLIRAVRIATELEFDIEKDTFKAIQKNAHFIKEIAWERIRDELLK